ncbi:hypothetical protein ACIPSJ_27600 [Streptomyces sp. NPDC090088]|uniref:hypothetical protein n=1 Tax=Streptomyces sp. NPDC090088 TaxID=3365944 RepID=UPI003826C993
MNAEERQSRILALARHQGRVKVTTMAVDLAVAPETVRCLAVRCSGPAGVLGA